MLRNLAKQFLSLFTAFVLIGLSFNTYAASNWTLDSTASRVAYGSIKKDMVGEANYFRTVNGTMTAAGEVSIEIDLSSVETNVETRNQRMVKHIFNEGALKATLSTEIDPSIISKLAPGATMPLSTDGTLTFLDKSIELDVDLFVAKLSDKSFMVTTDKMIMIKAADLGINEGLDTLMSLAKLPSITRVSPVTLRLVFESK